MVFAENKRASENFLNSLSKHILWLLKQTLSLGSKQIDSDLPSLIWRSDAG